MDREEIDGGAGSSRLRSNPPLGEHGPEHATAVPIGVQVGNAGTPGALEARHLTDLETCADRIQNELSLDLEAGRRERERIEQAAAERTVAVAKVREPRSAQEVGELRERPVSSRAQAR